MKKSGRVIHAMTANTKKQMKPVSFGCFKAKNLFLKIVLCLVLVTSGMNRAKGLSSNILNLILPHVWQWAPSRECSKRRVTHHRKKSINTLKDIISWVDIKVKNGWIYKWFMIIWISMINNYLTWIGGISYERISCSSSIWK